MNMLLVHVSDALICCGGYYVSMLAVSVEKTNTS